MKKFIKISVFLLFVLNSFGFSQTIDSKYEVGLWQNFCKVAVTHTFDDNEPNQLALASPLNKLPNKSIHCFLSRWQ